MSRFMPGKTSQLVVLCLLLCVIVVVSNSIAAFTIGRPLPTPAEPINQGYLYGVEGANGAIHKGLDWSAAAFGTDVYTVADGTVTQEADWRADHCHPPDCAVWGNYVLIRHDEQHYDRVTASNAYVYSLYLHLRQYSVTVNAGDHVARGQKIAEVDNTGNSTGTHLHLQIIIHQNFSGEIFPVNTIDSENRSRNPELWLEQYPPNRGTAIGLVTDSNGSPVANLGIFGIVKSAPNYANSRTYCCTALKGDDIFVESFGTTDVSPGTYNLQAKTWNGSSWTLYKDLGQHIFVGGQRTFIGLFPIYVPDIRTGGDWSTKIYVRNNSPSDTARTVTTFFNDSGQVVSQRTDFVSPNARLSLNPPTNFAGNVGSAAIVGSQDISAVTLMQRSSPFSSGAYVGVRKPFHYRFVPLVHRNNSGWNSQINIHNTGSTTPVSVIFRPGTAGSYCSLSNTIPTNGTWRIDTSDLTCLGNTFIGSAQINTSSQVASVSDLQYASNYNTLIASSSALEPSSSLYAPLIQNGNSGWVSGFNLQNTVSSSQTIWSRYYTPSGSNCRYDSYSVAAYGIVVQYPAPPSGSCSGNPILSARFGGSNLFNGQVNQILSGAAGGSGYPAVSSPTTKTFAPYVVRNSTWVTSLQVQNASSGTASITISFYNTSGSYIGNRTGSIPPYSTVIYYPASPWSSFNGSAVVSASRNIAVVVNHLRIDGSSGDTLMSHIAPNAD